MNINIGIPDENRKAIAGGLSRLLADTYSLFIKTHNFHWNVTGPMFNTLHAMFETQYTELFAAVDEIAERIRALGEFAPGSLGAFRQLSAIGDENTVPSATSMIERLVRDNETVVRTAREILPIAESANDGPTVDLLNQRMQIHEKTAWMLRSMLD
jgi:starvation-inducible DNA-binding protein